MDMYGKVVPGPCPVLWPMSWQHIHTRVWRYRIRSSHWSRYCHGEDSGRQQSSMGDVDSETDAGTALRGGTPSSSNATRTSTTANTVDRLIDKYYMYLSIYLYNLLNNLLLVFLYSSLSMVSRQALVCRLPDVTSCNALCEKWESTPNC